LGFDRAERSRRFSGNRGIERPGGRGEQRARRADVTTGSRRAARREQAAVAEGDVALGRLVGASVPSNRVVATRCNIAPRSHGSDDTEKRGVQRPVNPRIDR